MPETYYFLANPNKELVFPIKELDFKVTTEWLGEYGEYFRWYMTSEGVFTLDMDPTAFQYIFDDNGKLKNKI